MSINDRYRNGERLEPGLSHNIGAGDVGLELTNRIIRNNPSWVEKELRQRETVVATTIHDLGRFLNQNQFAHELRGANSILEHGQEYAISDDAFAIQRIAQMVRSHGAFYERWVLPENAKYRKEFEADGIIDLATILPATWQQQIITVCDQYDCDGERVTLAERKRRNALKNKGSSTG